jgi:putative spermidine/putrescine transport system ATP-binding protein
VLMNKGCIEQVAKPYEMYEQPNGRFASTFLGKANVFEGRSHAQGVAVGGLLLPLAGSTLSGELDYILRPEKLAFTATNPIVSGRVSARVFLGNHWLYQIETPLGELQLTHPNSGLPQAGEGDPVGLTWLAEHAHVVPRGARP